MISITVSYGTTVFMENIPLADEPMLVFIFAETNKQTKSKEKIGVDIENE